MFRSDPVELPPEAIALRAGVRSFTPEHKDVMGFSRGEHDREFSRAKDRMAKRRSRWTPRTHSP